MFLRFYLKDVIGTYKYPEEDFCLFRYFPLDHFVIAVVESTSPSKDIIEPTCSISYLLSNYLFYMDAYYFYEFNKYNLSYGKMCNFTQLLLRCDHEEFRSYNKRIYEISYYDFTHAFEWLEFFGPILTFPIVAMAGFLLNLVTSVILTRRKFKKDFEE